MTLREKIEVMEAFERGEEIEAAYHGHDIWSIMSTPSWNFEYRNYRIKPKPKQVVVIEKWLYMIATDQYRIIECSSNYKDSLSSFSFIKLLDTYKVEL